jgi:cytochrome d ubiquinol oxidase subunit II
VAEGDLWTSWWNPTSIATGLLAIGMCAYLAAVFLLGDASREDPRLVPGLRTRALAASGGFATLAATALPVVNWDAPSLGQELLRLPAAGFVGMAGVAGAVAAGLVATRQFLMARVAAGASAACVIWGWGAARYPTVLPGIGLDAAAADPEVLRALLWSTGVGMVMVLPSLAWLFVVAQRSPAARSGR